MTYIMVKKVIQNKRSVLEGEEWKAFQKKTMGKLDVFLLNNRLTNDEYNELSRLLAV